MRHRLLFIVAFGVLLFGSWSGAAPAAEQTVGVESRPGGAGTMYGDPLTRSAAARPTGHLAVYGGMALVGLTLAAVSLQRRSTMRSRPSGAGPDYRPRVRLETWSTAWRERVTAASAPSRRS